MSSGSTSGRPPGGVGSFLLRAPDRPRGAEPLPLEGRLGADYETGWARRYPVRLARALVLDNVILPLVRSVAPATVYGRENLDVLVGPVIVAANHASHLDTGVLLATLSPERRHHTVVAAAADYFFDRRYKAAAFAFSLGAIPMERTKVNRRSADTAARLIEEGWSLVIFPEGGRSHDGFGQELKGGAAYLAKRCGVPVVPAHLRGTRAVLPREGSFPVHLRPGPVEVRFGRALRVEGEDARRFAARIEAAVALLADEAESDWWDARLRAGRAESRPFRGPEGSAWRRAWSLPESADPAPRRRGRKRDWP